MISKSEMITVYSVSIMVIKKLQNITNKNIDTKIRKKDKKR